MDEILSYRQYVRPFYVMAKPAGARCNLRCTYCYYLEKSNLYPAAPAQTMSDELLERFIRDYIAAQAGDAVSFAWHGGETLLRSRDFYRRVVELQRRYADGRQIDNSIQTNGTLLDDAWCEFFRENGWLVGISLDGPPEAHDLYRRDRQGGPTFEAVMRGVALLQKHGVEWNALAVVNRHNADDPAGFYRFFRSIGCRFLQFTPVVERILPHDDGRQLASAADAGAPLADFSVTPEQWGRFTCALFDEWVVFPEYKLGNILETPLTELMRGPRQTAFGDAKLRALPTQCRRCRYLFACNGECPRNRFERTREGEPGLNYLCKGYQRFFRHAEPYMDFMRNELMHRRAPANVMEWARKRMGDGR